MTYCLVNTISAWGCSIIAGGKTHPSGWRFILPGAIKKDGYYKMGGIVVR